MQDLIKMKIFEAMVRNALMVQNFKITGITQKVGTHIFDWIVRTSVDAYLWLVLITEK